MNKKDKTLKQSRIGNFFKKVWKQVRDRNYWHIAVTIFIRCSCTCIFNIVFLNYETSLTSRKKSLQFGVQLVKVSRIKSVAKEGLRRC